jgi:hypothetical protein
MLALAISASSTTQSALPVVDRSEAGSPLVLYGALTAIQDHSTRHYAFKVHLTATNVSNKDIIFMVIRAESEKVIRFNLDDTEISEYFFECDAFATKTNRALELSSAPLGSPQDPRAPQSVPSTATATVRVLFVQFADGSTWGSPPRSAVEILNQRKHVFEELQSLLNTYRTKGEQQFADELMKPSLYGAGIGTLQNLYTEKHDLRTVIAKIDSMLHAADMHRQAMQEFP